MAIWQYTFEVVPMECVSGMESSTFVDMDQYNSSDFWKDRNCKTIWFEPLTQTLSLVSSWSKNLMVYGDEESTCIKLIVEGSEVAEVIVRIDYREEYSEFISTLIDFCVLNSLALLDEEYHVVPLNTVAIKALIENSPQYNKLKQM